MRSTIRICDFSRDYLARDTVLFEFTLVFPLVLPQAPRVLAPVPKVWYVAHL